MKKSIWSKCLLNCERTIQFNIVLIFFQTGINNQDAIIVVGDEAESIVTNSDIAEPDMLRVKKETSAGKVLHMSNNSSESFQVYTKYLFAFRLYYTFITQVIATSAICAFTIKFSIK